MNMEHLKARLVSRRNSWLEPTSPMCLGRVAPSVACWVAEHWCRKGQHVRSWKRFFSEGGQMRLEQLQSFLGSSNSDPGHTAWSCATMQASQIRHAACRCIFGTPKRRKRHQSLAPIAVPPSPPFGARPPGASLAAPAEAACPGRRRHRRPRRRAAAPRRPGAGGGGGGGRDADARVGRWEQLMVFCGWPGAVGCKVVGIALNDRHYTAACKAQTLR